MTESKWLACTDPNLMWSAITSKISERKRRLFAVACCRWIWKDLHHDARRAAVIRWHQQIRAYFTECEVDDPVDAVNEAESGLAVAERFADGLASQSELEASYEVARKAVDSADSVSEMIVNESFPKGANKRVARERSEQEYRAAYSTYATTAPGTLGDPYWLGANIDYLRYPDSQDSYPLEQVRLLREIFSDLIRKIRFKKSWRTSTVMALANGIYDEKVFDRIPILADALQDAGCDSEEILNHLRQPEEHCRGCWALDLVLGKS